jgi:hypothetical protein
MASNEKWTYRKLRTAKVKEIEELLGRCSSREVSFSGALLQIHLLRQRWQANTMLCMYVAVNGVPHIAGSPAKSVQLCAVIPVFLNSSLITVAR